MNGCTDFHILYTEGKGERRGISLQIYALSSEYLSARAPVVSLTTCQSFLRKSKELSSTAFITSRVRWKIQVKTTDTNDFLTSKGIAISWMKLEKLLLLTQMLFIYLNK